MGSGKVYCPPESVISFLRVSWALTKGQNLGGHPCIPSGQWWVDIKWPKREVLSLMCQRLRPLFWSARRDENLGDMLPAYWGFGPESGTHGLAVLLMSLYGG